MHRESSRRGIEQQRHQGHLRVKCKSFIEAEDDGALAARVRWPADDRDITLDRGIWRRAGQRSSLKKYVGRCSAVMGALKDVSRLVCKPSSF
ncbi:MAG TPA: hypothetical protein VJ859_05805 [Allosphingosinicella sp.]|nr:hypothetical protein [Allosphingosinicella sp.]